MAETALEHYLEADGRPEARDVRDDLFSEDLVGTWIAFEREAEVEPVRLWPHPAELELHFEAWAAGRR